MASVIKAGNATDGVQVTSDNTGILELKTGTGAGTTAMTVGTDQAVTFAQAANLPNTFGFKNRIINGAMVINQRAASITATGYSVDRWQYSSSQSSKATIAQSSVAPAGFIKSLGVTSSSAYSVLSGDYFILQQGIEGFNVADLGWGAAGAQTVTLSFWVRSSLTGTFGGNLVNGNNTRSYPFSYTISAANTWEQKTITIPGDTTGTWATDNTAGMYITFGLGVGTTYSGTAGTWGSTLYFSVTGATSVVGTNGATFYITGVQLEKGSTATSFDYRPYSTELQLAQRYYYRTSGSVNTVISTSAVVNAATTARVNNQFPVTMRAEPTALSQSGTAGDYILNYGAAQQTCSAVPAFVNANTQMASADFTVASGLTTGNSAYVRCANTNAFLAWSAEL